MGIDLYYYYRNSYFFFQFYPFLLPLLWGFTIRHTKLIVLLPALLTAYVKCATLALTAFYNLNSILFDISVDILLSFGYFFNVMFISILSLSIYLCLVLWGYLKRGRYLAIKTVISECLGLSPGSLLLIQFPANAPHGKQQMMAQQLGSLLPVWDSWLWPDSTLATAGI